MKLEQTFMNFLLEHQQHHKRTLNFLILMESIVTAAKNIQHFYAVGALQRNLGEAGLTNVQGEGVMQMDLIANDIVLHYLRQSKQVVEATSEELTEEIALSDTGRYFVYFDPLDGSSNIKHSLPVGFLFGIAKRDLDGPEDYHLRRGDEYIAAGMFLIPSGIFTMALKDAGCWRFVHDQCGVYIRPERVTLPTDSKTWELSYNSANLHTFSKPVQDWAVHSQSEYAFRYTGSLAVDFHRLLHNGGMFMYPAVVNHPDPKKNRPEGKLRLMYECNVVAFLAREAGGLAVNEQGDAIWDVQPQKRHQRSALYIGNTEVVSEVREVLREQAAKDIQRKLELVKQNAESA